MRLHNFIFLSAFFFVLGAVISGLGFTIMASLMIVVAIVALFIFWKVRPAVVIITAIFVLLGSSYYLIDDARYKKSEDGIANISEFVGIVIEEPKEKLKNQSSVVKIKSPPWAENARIIVHSDLHPKLSYGDIVSINGNVISSANSNSENSYKKYLAKERIHGTVFYPELEISGNDGGIFFGNLYKIRNNIKDKIVSIFDHNQSSLLAGVILGDRSEMPEELFKKLSISGTLHITALSGLHMSIIILIATLLFSSMLGGKKWTIFSAVFIFIALFVAMTGFKISAIRASFMALLAGLALNEGRKYNPGGALVLAAGILVIINPKLPTHDLAFQLSFVATLSIIYLFPVIKKLPFFNEKYKINNNENKNQDKNQNQSKIKKLIDVNWKDILAITIAAQIAVAPIAITNFANFSFSAIPANLAILIIMPVIMMLGIGTIAMSFVYMPIAELLGKFVSMMLGYMQTVVEIFYALRIPFNPELGPTVIILYYITLIAICIKYSPLLTDVKEKVRIYI